MKITSRLSRHLLNRHTTGPKQPSVSDLRVLLQLLVENELDSNGRLVVRELTFQSTIHTLTSEE